MSEFRLIERHFSKHAKAFGVSLGVGDDCAVIDVSTGQQLVTCVDTLVAGRHFPMDTPAHAIGYKSVAVNLSDLAAMGAAPHSITLALSLPAHDEDWLGEFSRGIYDCCQDFGVALIGGDTTCSPTLTISVSAFGFVPTGQAIRRGGAQVGDVICLSGQVGSAAFALHHPGSALRSALDYPRPQVALGLSLRGFANSMIDISDGLAQDLGHILTASGVGALLQLAQIPLADELKRLDFKVAMRHALTGGDDYQLLFSLPPEKLEQFRQAHPSLTIHPIGTIVQGSGLQLFDGTQPIQMDTQGWQHF